MHKDNYQAPEIDKRERALKMRAEGRTSPEISKALGVSQREVRGWCVRRSREFSGSNSVIRLSESHEKKIKENLIKNSPDQFGLNSSRAGGLDYYIIQFILFLPLFLPDDLLKLKAVSDFVSFMTKLVPRDFFAFWVNISKDPERVGLVYSISWILVPGYYIFTKLRKLLAWQIARERSGESSVGLGAMMSNLAFPFVFLFSAFNPLLDGGSGFHWDWVIVLSNRFLFFSPIMAFALSSIFVIVVFCSINFYRQFCLLICSIFRGVK